MARVPCTSAGTALSRDRGEKRAVPLRAGYRLGRPHDLRATPTRNRRAEFEQEKIVRILPQAAEDLIKSRAMHAAFEQPRYPLLLACGTVRRFCLRLFPRYPLPRAATGRLTLPVFSTPHWHLIPQRLYTVYRAECPYTAYRPSALFVIR